MMREIKFRAWDKKHLKMIETIKTIRFNAISSFIELIESAYDLNIVNGQNSGEHNLLYGDFELMQFTGLEDKNGKEVYEGDIIMFSSMQYDGELLPYIIAFDCSWGGQFMAHSSLNYDYVLDNDYERYWEEEVIGNIYENPELLKEVRE